MRGCNGFLQLIMNLYINVRCLSYGVKESASQWLSQGLGVDSRDLAGGSLVERSDNDIFNDGTSRKN